MVVLKKKLQFFWRKILCFWKFSKILRLVIEPQWKGHVPSCCNTIFGRRWKIVKKKKLYSILNRGFYGMTSVICWTNLKIKHIYICIRSVSQTLTHTYIYIYEVQINIRSLRKTVTCIILFIFHTFNHRIRAKKLKKN